VAQVRRFVHECKVCAETKSTNNVYRFFEKIPQGKMWARVHIFYGGYFLKFVFLKEINMTMKYEME